MNKCAERTLENNQKSKYDEIFEPHRLVFYTMVIAPNKHQSLDYRRKLRNIVLTRMHKKMGIRVQVGVWQMRAFSSDMISFVLRKIFKVNFSGRQVKGRNERG